MEARSDVVVIGGGVVGVSAAYFLAQGGARVTLLERGAICSGCSYGNAGWVFPSHSTPLPAPGVLRQALAWLFDPESPFYVRPRFDLELARWLFDFLRACTEERMRRTFALNRDLSLASRGVYEKLAALPGLDFGYTQNGLLVLCEERESLDDAGEELELLASLGGEGRLLDGGELRELVPQVAPAIAGGVFLPVDAHVEPAAFVEGLAREAERSGVRIETGTEAMELETDGARIRRVVATRGEFACDRVVLAGGAWSPGLVKPHGVRLPIQAAKGYSITFERQDGVGRTPLMLYEAKVGVSPFRETLRVAGTLELTGLDLSINMRRVRAIERAAQRFLPGLASLERIETWRGLRPCTPDDLPVIGSPRRLPELVIASGHGMSGISQGPITGQLVAELVTGETPSLDLAPFSPDRF